MSLLLALHGTGGANPLVTRHGMYFDTCEPVPVYLEPVFTDKKLYYEVLTGELVFVDAVTGRLLWISSGQLGNVEEIP